MMQRTDRIFVAGHRGLVGSALLRRLIAQGFTNVLAPSHAELDLVDQQAVRAFFAASKPDHVIMAAAKVGGILANDTYPAEFIYANTMMQSNVIDAAYRSGVRKLLFLGSSCIYPKFASQPITEDQLLAGPLEPTNEAYAIAKIAGIKMCSAYNRQYGTNFLAVMPTNLYGPGDTYDPVNSHVIPALIVKMHAAKQRGDAEVVLWGTGTPRREFLYSDDLAAACVFLMTRHDARDVGELINVGTGRDITVRDLAELVRRVVEFQGRIVFDPEKPDGTPRKLLDVSRMTRLGWTADTGLEQGLGKAYEDFLARPDRRIGSVRGGERAATRA
jgi:GDP-L-fucose synthase